ncbi:MAG: mannose-6-phosphate isomerase [Flaviaesturariibacter sp.]|nr:mannose-6-phosphate isomerase [Flaviaesturariibacter sp.]
MQHIYLLEGAVQHYSWGGYEYLPQLLDTSNNEHLPFAEYWLGVHPLKPSVIRGLEEMRLPDFIKEDVSRLGEYTANKFKGLPFLLKVLDVRQMLSIQVHPNLEQGREGFAKENALGVPLDAPNRNYKDANHKPELMVALSDFWLLHGFKPETQLIKVLEEVPEFSHLLLIFREKGYKGLYEYVMRPSVQETEAMLNSIQERILPQYEAGSLEKSSPDFWAARAFQTYSKKDQPDKGIFSIYFFNLLHLKKGEGLFQDAGLPHAYLEGQNVEIMANSDNVLRAGLTEKHIDIPELMRLVQFEPTYPTIIAAETVGPTTYHSPAAEFQLSNYYLKAGESVSVSMTEASILLMLTGTLSLRCGDEKIRLTRGKSCFCTAEAVLQVMAEEESSLFIATIPTNKTGNG